MSEDPKLTDLERDLAARVSALEARERARDAALVNLALASSSGDLNVSVYTVDRWRALLEVCDPQASPRPRPDAERTARMNDSLKLEIQDGKLVISIGISTLCFAATHGPYFDEIVGDADGEEVTVTDKTMFAQAIMAELEREEEDGTTLVHKMFDKAAEAAVEGGAEGIELPRERL